VNDEWIGSNLEETSRGLVEILIGIILEILPGRGGGKKDSSVAISSIPPRFATGTP